MVSDYAFSEENHDNEIIEVRRKQKILCKNEPLIFWTNFHRSQGRAYRMANVTTCSTAQHLSP